jgi:hypothetical protein
LNLTEDDEILLTERRFLKIMMTQPGKRVKTFKNVFKKV